MNDYPKLTIEQLEALQEYAQKNGRNWKSKLGIDWACSGHNNPHLQQVRNVFGPTWLMNFSFDKYPKV